MGDWGLLLPVYDRESCAVDSEGRKKRAKRGREVSGRSLVVSRSRGLTEPAAIELRVGRSVLEVTGPGGGREHVAELLVGPHPVTAAASGIVRCVRQRTLRQWFGRRAGQAATMRVAIRGDFLGVAFDHGEVGLRRVERD